MVALPTVLLFPPAATRLPEKRRKIIAFFGHLQFFDLVIYGHQKLPSFTIVYHVIHAVFLRVTKEIHVR